MNRTIIGWTLIILAVLIACLLGMMILGAVVFAALSVVAGGIEIEPFEWLADHVDMPRIMFAFVMAAAFLFAGLHLASPPDSGRDPGRRRDYVA